jgi:hypothetical protein
MIDALCANLGLRWSLDDKSARRKRAGSTPTPIPPNPPPGSPPNAHGTFQFGPERATTYEIGGDSRAAGSWR